MDQGFTLELRLVDPYGKAWSVRLPIDAFEASERYVGLTPPSEFDVGNTMDSVVKRIRTREYRKDDFKAMCLKLAQKLGERMEDEEGWHGVDRQATYEQLRREGRA